MKNFIISKWMISNLKQRVLTMWITFILFPAFLEKPLTKPLLVHALSLIHIQITVYDTTLRDGEQTPGVCLQTPEKLKIARKLDELGLHQIEAGFPVVSKEENRSVKAIVRENLDAEILVLSRTKKEDIDMALDCDVDGIITFLGTSSLHLKHKLKFSQEDALNICMSSIEHAKDHDLFVAFSAEDATRTDLDFLKKIYNRAELYGADRVHIADTVGAISPQGMDYLVTELKNEINIEIALHCHNDFGMALSNCISGLPVSYTHLDVYKRQGCIKKPPIP